VMRAGASTVFQTSYLGYSKEIEFSHQSYTVHLATYHFEKG